MNDGTSLEAWDAFVAREKALRRNGNGHGTTMAIAAAQWQTPASDSFRSRSGDRKHEQGLDQQARRQWATPVANADSGSRNCEGSQAHPGTSLADQVTTGSSQTGRQGNTRRLNPRFVAWLMGFPIDWTAEVPRVDQLRALGNAVVPDQAAYAVTVLWRELEAHADEGE